MHYYFVAPTTIVRKGCDTLTYQSEEMLALGSVVFIPIGTKETLGVVVNTTKKPSFATKPISRVLPVPPLPAHLIHTALWMADYYTTPLPTVFQTMLPRGITKKRRATYEPEAFHTQELPPLTHAQRDAYQELSASRETTLLHGITGSGKTRLYIELAREKAQVGLSTILLVPEIALTAQLIEHLKHAFPRVIVTHSQQSEATRHAIWQYVAQTNEPMVIIGPRSALFLPVKSLGAIIIDECHEPSYKQEKAPRYSALRTARTMAQSASAKLVLGSATPLLTDYFVASQASRSITSLAVSARTVTPPTVACVDRTKRTYFTEHPLFSDALLAAMRTSFEAGEQVLLFHNRRGSASLTLCESCGWQALCRDCFIPLTLHGDRHKLICHTCGITERVPSKCPDCTAVDIIFKGVGTKRIEQEITRLFPNKKCVRYDADTEAKDALHTQYDQLLSGEIDIIIGTQIIAKGLDLPRLGTVGIVQADTGLHLPDFTSSERTFELLTQAIGRVGRDARPTTVVVQTFTPQHPSIQASLTQDYHAFYTHELEQRKRGYFPPFCHLLTFVCSYKTEAAAVRNAKSLLTTLSSRAEHDVQLLGPIPAFYERKNDTYRWHIIAKSPTRTHLQALVTHLPSTHWQYELDPTTLLV